MGNQRRSWSGIRQAIDELHGGVIGRPYLAQAFYAANRPSIGRGKEVAVLPRLNWDLWQGSAPRKPFRDNFVHYNWHWFWDWGNGELGNNGVHALDVCRWGLGAGYPIRVDSTGGRYRYDDDHQTPANRWVPLREYSYSALLNGSFGHKPASGYNNASEPTGGPP